MATIFFFPQAEQMNAKFLKEIFFFPYQVVFVLCKFFHQKFLHNDFDVSRFKKQLYYYFTKIGIAMLFTI